VIPAALGLALAAAILQVYAAATGEVVQPEPLAPLIVTMAVLALAVDAMRQPPDGMA